MSKSLDLLKMESFIYQTLRGIAKPRKKNQVHSGAVNQDLKLFRVKIFPLSYNLDLFQIRYPDLVGNCSIFCKSTCAAAQPSSFSQFRISQVLLTADKKHIFWFTQCCDFLSTNNNANNSIFKTGIQILPGLLLRKRQSSQIGHLPLSVDLLYALLVLHLQTKKIIFNLIIFFFSLFIIVGKNKRKFHLSDPIHQFFGGFSGKWF